MTTAHDWTGKVGDVWAREWRRTDRSFTELSARLDTAIVAAAPNGRFRALDIGCGAGGTTLALLAARPEDEVVGIDLSRGLLTIAADRVDAAGHGARATFLSGDAAALAAQHGAFDLMISRHGVMFFADPHAAFAALHDAASPGASLVFSCFRDWRQNGFYRALADVVGAAPPEPDAPGPFAFADRDRVAAILSNAGWRDAAAEPVDFTYIAGCGAHAVADATEFLTSIGPAAARLRDLAEAEHPAVRDHVRAVMADHLSDGAVAFPAAAWIWTATA